MIELYNALSGVNPNALNAVLTVLDGPDFGDKCLLSGGKLLWERDEGGFFARHMEQICGVDKSQTLGIDGRSVFCEVLGNEKKFVICGGGHVSMPLIRLGLMLGCPVTVLEDRLTFADNARRAGATQVICDAFANGLAQIEGDADTYFIIVTRGHRYDRECLNAITRKPHAYIGMIGSRRRVAMVKKALIEEDGCDPEVVGSVYSPIGLDIGAETPEEIAIAIMAQIIQVKSAGGRNSSYPRDLMRAILAEADRAMPKALITIVARKGSAPRDVGTKMLVYPDGRFVGTIGGGCVESDVVRSARMLLDEKDPSTQILDVDMTDDDAEDAGMVCGGVIRVLVEVIEPARGIQS